MPPVEIILQGQDDASGVIGNVAGALGGITDIAGGALAVALGGVLKDAFDAVTGAMGDFFGQALGAEQQQAQLGIQVRNANQALADQARAWNAAAGQTVTGTALSASALAKLNDQYDVAKAKLDDMMVSYPKLKHPTETQTLAFETQKETVQALADKISAGSAVISTKLTDALKLIPPAAGFSVDGLNKLAEKYKDLVGGSDETVTAIEMVGIKAGSVSADQMPQFIQRTADLGAVMGSTSAAALLLARANEDPVAAMNKANKAGILFDESLKEQIKTMVKHNDTAGATALVLDRIAQATAGAAAANAGTLAGRIEILKNNLADMGKGILEKVLPGLELLFDQYIKPNIPVIESIAGAIGDRLGQAIGALSASLVNFPSDPIGAIADMLYKIAGSTGIDAFNSLGDALVSLPGLFTQLQSAITPVVNLIVAQMPAVQAALSGAWTWVLAHQDEIKRALIAIGGALAAAGIVGLVLSIAAAIAGLITPVGAVIAIVAVLGAAWAGNWGGIRDILTSFWNQTALPILTELWTWLQTNVPQALQTLANYWTGTLQPALTQVYNWITGTLIPNLSTLWTWLGTTLTAALTSLAGFWTGTLQPAMTAVWSWMTANLFPFLTSLGNLISAVLHLALTGLAYDWQYVVLPAVTTLYNFLRDYVLPKFQDITSHISGPLGTALANLGTWASGLVSGALANLNSILGGISAAANTLTGYINGLIGLINSIPHIPGIPGGGGSAPSSSAPSVSNTYGPTVNMTVNTSSVDVPSLYNQTMVSAGAY